MTSPEMQDIPENVLAMLGREPTEKEAAILADYTGKNGIAEKFNRKIGIVNIDHPIIVKAFKNFIDKSGSGMESFRLIDLLSFNESVCKGGFAYGNVGEYILCFSRTPSDRKLAKRIFQKSVNGMYELIDRTNGFALDLSAVPELGIEELMSKRFVFAEKRKVPKIKKKAALMDIKVNVLGMVTSEKRIFVMRSDTAEINLDKQLLYCTQSSDVSTVNISSEMFDNYKKGFLSVFGYKYAISALRHCQVVFGADNNLSELLAALLGIYSASKVLPLTAVKIMLTHGNSMKILSEPVSVKEDDKVYLIKPSFDMYGIPMADSYNKVNAYLKNISMGTLIHAVCPVTGSIKETVRQILGTDYVMDIDINNLKSEQEECSVLVVTPVEIQGTMLGVVKHRQ